MYIYISNTTKVLGLYILLAGELVCLQARRKVLMDFRLSVLQSVSISIVNVVRGRKSSSRNSFNLWSWKAGQTKIWWKIDSV